MNKCGQTTYKSLIAISLLLLCIDLYPQSVNHNYIQTKTFLDNSASTFLRHIDYYDEMGYVAEAVDVGINTSGTPILQKTEYDTQIKPYILWAPTPVSSLDYIGEDVYDVASITHNDYTPYGMNEYDDFQELKVIGKPGEAWENHVTTITRHVVHTGVVKKYSVSSNGELCVDGTYQYGLLTSTTTTDEDGHTTTVYTNMHDNVILERRGEDNDTYYVYDNYGRLCYVLPPMCQQCEISQFSKYWYKYRYDDRGRCIEKQLPGCDAINYWYDNANRILSEQDGHLHDQMLYRNFCYDGIGRLTLQTISSVQEEANLNNAEIVEVRNYYDGYSQDIANSFTTWADSINTVYTDPMIVRGKLTASLYTTSCSNNYIETYSYDIYGRMKSKLSAYGSKWMKTTKMGYNFIGDALNIEENVFDVRNENRHFLAGRRTENTYHPSTRLLASTTVTHIDSNGNTSTQMTSNPTYDVFGNVIANNRPGTAADVSYTYDTLHGWLSGISSPSGFSEQLLRADASNPQYSGSIGALLWRNSNNGEVHKYDFTYDNLARLTDSQYSSSITANAGHFNESVTYDCQGAITSLLRYGKKNNGTFGIIDNLSISYDGNRLLNVADDADPLYYNGALDFNDGASLDVEYEYNSIGSLVRDSNRGIDNISYDYCRNPQFISMGNGQKTIEYDYTPDGRKLEKKHNSLPWVLAPQAIHPPIINPILTATKDTYIDGLILRNGNPLMWQFDGGYVALNSSATPTSWNYYITDHLGSTRKVVTDANTIQETINYYPYGSEMRLTDPAVMPNSTFKESFRFSGKELDWLDGLNMYDFGARMFDVAGVPVWTSVDPLAEKNSHFTPYSYCNGDPVNKFDPDGRSTTDYYGLNGKLFTSVEDGSQDKRLILNDGGNGDKEDAITNGETIPVPSNAVVDQMANCFEQTESSGNETGFRVGVKGTVTGIVTGQSGEISATDWKPAMQELRSKNEYAAYDVHTHPLGQPETGTYGIARPSDCDKNNIIGTQTGNHPSAVLGYKEVQIPGYGMQPVKHEYQRQISYYNGTGIVGVSMSFRKFRNAVKKINMK